MLIKRAGVTGFLFNYPSYRMGDHSVMEFDLSLHPFPYLFKQGMTYLKDHYFPKMLMTFSFVIEGRDDDELPEVLIGDGLQLCYPDPSEILQAEDVFGGDAFVKTELS